MPIFRDRDPVVTPVEYTEAQADLRAAYNRGRADERRNRNSHPFIVLGVVALALIGAWLLYLAAREGSFSSAGQVADQNLSTAAQVADRNLSTAAQQGGEAIQQAGANLKDKGQDLVNRDQTRPPAQTPAR